MRVAEERPRGKVAAGIGRVRPLRWNASSAVSLSSVPTSVCTDACERGESRRRGRDTARSRSGMHQ